MGRAPSMPVSNTKPERRLQDALRLLNVPVWECSPRDILRGAPDLYWRHRLPRPLAVMVDGCQFHGCPQHFRPFRSKDPMHRMTPDGTARQKHHDRVSRAAMRAAGYEVMSFWEHEVNGNARVCAQLIAEALSDGSR